MNLSVQFGDAKCGSRYANDCSNAQRLPTGVLCGVNIPGISTGTCLDPGTVPRLKNIF